MHIYIHVYVCTCRAPFCMWPRWRGSRWPWHTPSARERESCPRRYTIFILWDFRNGGRSRHGNQRELAGVRRRLAKERRHMIDIARGGELFSSLSHSSLAQTEARWSYTYTCVSLFVFTSVLYAAEVERLPMAVAHVYGVFAEQDTIYL